MHIPSDWAQLWPQRSAVSQRQFGHRCGRLERRGHGFGQPEVAPLADTRVLRGCVQHSHDDGGRGRGVGRPVCGRFPRMADTSIVMASIRMDETSIGMDETSVRMAEISIGMAEISARMANNSVSMTEISVRMADISTGMAANGV